MRPSRTSSTAFARAVDQIALAFRAEADLFAGLALRGFVRGFVSLEPASRQSPVSGIVSGPAAPDEQRVIIGRQIHRAGGGERSKCASARGDVALDPICAVDAGQLPSVFHRVENALRLGARSIFALHIFQDTCAFR